MSNTSVPFQFHAYRPPPNSFRSTPLVVIYILNRGQFFLLGSTELPMVVGKTRYENRLVTRFTDHGLCDTLSRQS